MSEAERPDPDVILAQMKREEAESTRGKLKIFFGMSPGVGKTYAMLEAAQRELRAGRGVLIGYVETHGRTETDSMLAGSGVTTPIAVNATPLSRTDSNMESNQR